MPTNISLDAIRRLIEENAPYLHMDSGEKYMPSSFPWFLARPELCLGDPSHRVSVPNPLPSGDSSRDQFLAYSPWNTSSIAAGDLASAKVYIHAIPSSAFGEGGLALQFWFFYPFNGPGTANVSFEISAHLLKKWKDGFKFSVDLRPFGEHQGDWEHATLLFDPSHVLRKIIASEHNYETPYYPPGTPNQKCWTQSAGRPVLYSARNGHPTYADTGIIPTSGAEQKFHVDIGLKVASVSIDIAVALENICSAGPVLDCAASGELIAIDGLGISMPEPSWLQFMGRCGWVNPPAGDAGKEFIDDFEEGFLKQLKAILPKVLADNDEHIANTVINSVLPNIVKWIATNTDSFDGPRMPKAHPNWNSDTD